MCELFGICSKECYVINDYIKEFYSHSNMHPHGWGLACLNGSDTFIEKEPIQATKSNYLKERLSVPIQVKNAFAHIRYATIGNVEYPNCHPYTKKEDSGRRWILIHNGTIFRYPPLDRFIKSQTGDTDSERILLYLIEQINDMEHGVHHKLKAEERFCLLDSVATLMAYQNGALVFQGTEHGNEYVDKEDDLKHLYQIFSDL